jgi:amino acid transporter
MTQSPHEPDSIPDTNPIAHLRAGTLSLNEVLMQSITSVGPAVSVFVTFQPGVGMAGIDAPLVYLADVVIVLMLGSTLFHLATVFPSAGGYFTYVSRTLNPRVGFLVSWAFMLYSAISPGVLFGFLGRFLSLTAAPYGVDLPWIVPFAGVAALTGVIIYRGVEFSGRSLMVIGVLEIGIVLAFGIWGFVAPRAGHVSFAPFDPHRISAGAFAISAVFGIFVYTGWESIAPMAEESANPRRTIPLATVASIVFSCALIVLCTWGMLLSWGLEDIAGIIKDPSMPALTLARRIWGPGWWLIVFAVANSIIGAGVGMSMVSSRMWFAMARVGALPALFASVHPRFQTPVAATWLQIALFVVVGIGGALWFGIDNLYLVGGLITVFAAIFIYIAANVGLSYYMWKRHRADFRWRQHGVYPFVSTIALLILCYKSIVPLPDYPVRWAPIIVAIWMLMGLLLVMVSFAMGREEWLHRTATAAQPPRRSNSPI